MQLQINKLFKIFAIIIFGLLLNGCGKECYKSELQLRAAYESCSDLGTKFSTKINKSVWTFACTTSSDDVYADFIVSDEGELCRTYQLEY